MKAFIKKIGGEWVAYASEADEGPYVLQGFSDRYGPIRDLVMKLRSGVDEIYSLQKATDVFGYRTTKILIYKE